MTSPVAPLPGDPTPPAGLVADPTSTSTPVDPAAVDPATDPAPLAGTVSREEYEAVVRRMKAADRRSSELEAADKARVAATQTETERLVAERDELKASREADVAALRELRIQNAFLSANTHAWVDMEDALRLADLSEVTIDEDGKVDGKALRKALDDLAKRKPHLVKAETSGATPPAGASAPALNGTPKGAGDRSPDRAALAKRFPVLGQFQ